MGNIIYDLKIVNEKIREDLKREFPNLLFSVSKDSGTIYIALMSGNIKPFRALTKAEEEGYLYINHHYINDDASLSEIGKSVMMKVKAITDKYNYDNSDIQTDYFDKNFYINLKIGKGPNQPYLYKFKKSRTTTSSTPRPNTSNDELLYDFKTWKLFKRHIGEKVVFVLIKNKETPANKENWLQIKIDINIASGMKWNPKYQHFDKWDRLSEDAVFELEKVINKYYPQSPYNATQQMMAQATSTPQQSVPQYDQAFQDATPTNVTIKELTRTFANPSLVTNKDVRLQILKTLGSRIDDSFEYYKENTDTWLRDMGVEKFVDLDVDFDGDVLNYDLLDGIKLDFSSEQAKRRTKRNLILRILDLGGIPNGVDVLFGVYNTVPGEENSKDNEKYEKERAQEEGRDMYLEMVHVGGLLIQGDWYSLMNAVRIAVNFINDEFEASFKYPDFTKKFKNETDIKDVILDDVDYQEKPIKSEARMYIVSKDNKYVYLLEQGGYSGLYSNSWTIGLKMMQTLKDYTSGYLDYVKDIDAYGGGLVGAKEFLPQLIAQAPEYFPKEEIINEREVIQQQIDDLELLLKVSDDMSEEDKKAILSQVLDLHTLLNLI
jgi:hypothetical protein